MEGTSSEGQEEPDDGTRAPILVYCLSMRARARHTNNSLKYGCPVDYEDDEEEGDDDDEGGGERLDAPVPRVVAVSEILLVSPRTCSYAQGISARCSTAVCSARMPASDRCLCR